MNITDGNVKSTCRIIWMGGVDVGSKSYWNTVSHKLQGIALLLTDEPAPKILKLVDVLVAAARRRSMGVEITTEHRQALIQIGVEP